MMNRDETGKLVSEPEYEKELARISSAELGFEDHGIFGVNINFEFESASQGTGWYTLNNLTGGKLLSAIMQAAGVSRWEDLKGVPVYVLRDKGNPFGQIVGFEKLPINKQGGRIIFKDVFNKTGK